MENKLKIEMEINFKNHAHLGDHIYHLHYCDLLKEKYPDISINYYVNPEYIPILNWHWVNIKAFAAAPKNAVHAWINLDDAHGHFHNGQLAHGQGGHFDIFHLLHFKKLSDQIGLECPVTDIKDVLPADKRFLKENSMSHSPGGGKWDVLFINSPALSEQWAQTGRFNEMIKIMHSKGLSVITTAKTNLLGVACVTDKNLHIYDIGNVAINSKYVIGVHTGPFVAALNKYAYETVEKFVLFQQSNLTYSYNKCHSLQTANGAVQYISELIKK